MRRLFVSLIALAAVTVSFAQLNPMSPVPADKDVRYGKLENGMTYYVRRNAKPQGQADFYILHDVGAIQEEDSQQGLAHFLEHMAFNGTKNLPDKMLIEYLETIGVKFGANLNAGTGWDQTTYMIKDVPTTRQGIIDSALLILHDWSHFITLKGEEIDSERGVITEELRTRDGAQWRSTMALIQSIGKDTRYEHRNLIGHLEGLNSFEHQELVDFYNKWYRPDLQAIVVVGDIDAVAVEEQIKTLMSDIPTPAADAAKKEVINVPNNVEPIVTIYADPEMQMSRIQMMVKRPAMPKEQNGLVLGHMVSIIEKYVAEIENARLQEIANQPDAPFLGAGMGSSTMGIIPTLDAATYIAVTNADGITRGFETLYTEMERVRRHGYTYGEWERAKENLMKSAERAYANADDRRNGDYVQIYLHNYSKNTPMPDAKTKWQLDSTLISVITVDAVNAFAKQTLMPENQVIVITAQEKEGVTVPTQEEILAIRAKVSAAEIAPYEDNVVKEPLISEDVELKGSKVAKTETNEVLGTTTWTLKNGTKVVVKPTEYKADELLLNITAKGGLSLLSDEEFYMGELMPAVNSMSGVGKFSSSDLSKQLSGKTASVYTSAGNYTSSMSGSASPKDVETLLQLVYLNFMQPRFNESDYNNLIKMVSAQLENAQANPDYVAEERFIDIAYGSNPRRQMITTDILATFDFASLPAIYAKLFPAGNNFTYTFVGNIDLEVLKPLVEKYIGSIKSSKEELNFIDDNARLVEGQVEEQYRVAMQQPKVNVRYLYSGDMENNFKNRTALSLLKDALRSRYLVSIREEKGGTYGVGVSSSTEFLPEESYELSISFDTNDEIADELCEIVVAEIEKIAAEGPLVEDIEKSREFLLKSWPTSLEQNGSWMRYITSYNEYGLDYLGEYENTIKSVTAADVQAMAKKMLEDGNLVKVIMRPETAEAAPAE